MGILTVFVGLTLKMITKIIQVHSNFPYPNDPKFFDRLVYANSADPEEQSDQGLYYLQYCQHLLDTLLNGKPSFFQFYDDYSKVF